MVAPYFTKRQIAFLGIGTMLPACFLWLTLLDQARIAEQARVVPNLQTQVRQAVASSPKTIMGIVSDVKASKSQLTITTVVGNATADYIVSVTPSTKIVDRPVGSDQPTTSYTFKDLSNGSFVAVAGTGQRLAMTASVVEIDRSSIPIATSGQKMIYLPTATTSSEPVMPASEMAQQSKGGK